MQGETCRVACTLGLLPCAEPLDGAQCTAHPVNTAYPAVCCSCVAVAAAAGKCSFPVAWQGYQACASYDLENWFRCGKRGGGGHSHSHHVKGRFTRPMWALSLLCGECVHPMGPTRLATTNKRSQ